jgi:hypothetical protein
MITQEEKLEIVEMVKKAIYEENNESIEKCMKSILLKTIKEADSSLKDNILISKENTDNSGASKYQQ